MSRPWLVLHYQLPREPSAPRVSLWRKLKKLGATLTLDTLWVLPESDRNREQFRWLSAEIEEHGGRATLWVAISLLAGQDALLEAALLEPVETTYAQMLAAMKTSEPDLDALAKQFESAQRQDHLKSALGKQVRAALEQRRGKS